MNSCLKKAQAFCMRLVLGNFRMVVESESNASRAEAQRAGEGKKQTAQRNDMTQFPPNVPI